MGDKDIKKEFKAIASKNPDKYYATSVLKNEGFVRRQCRCGTFFWTTNAGKAGNNNEPEQETCGDPACSGGFRFIGSGLVKEKVDYIQVWEKFAKHFKKLGYTPINRYPVVARWRDDTDFVQASIYDFQPYVVSGEVKPPANPLVVPQFCLRFNDIDNVGITGAHFTGFVMIGQHAFMPPKEFNQTKYFEDIHSWLSKGLKLPNSEITYHEDAWAGGGNFGPCMEFFSRGLELGNQVYMQYEVLPAQLGSNGKFLKPVKKELNLKVLDMGMGHERNAWFTKASATSYEAVFPTVCKKLYNATGVKVDADLMKKFLPYASYLNVDEVDNIDKTWGMVAKKVGVDKKELKDLILPLSGIYSIGDHTRSLLVALNDGAIPSNVGGGYNLRVILRRALSFIDRFGWDIDLIKVSEWHADYLQKLFPELRENLNEVAEILKVEQNKYDVTKQKTRQIVEKLIKYSGDKGKQKIDDKKLMELYDSQGISPEIIREEALKQNIRVNVPDNFYAKVAELHEQKEQKHATVKKDKLDLDGIDETKGLYFDDWKTLKFKGKVQKVIDNKVVLDKTAFYPTSGGQLHDLGTLQGEKVVDIFKQGSVILHVLEKHHEFSIGEELSGEVELERRRQLAQHHTATHIIGAAARRVLGRHINQAGAKKTTEKAHIDLTHYNSLTDDEIKKIEEEANKIVNEDIPVRKNFMSRDDAEKMFGMNIYQGGAVPGNSLRIVEIPEVDVQACGGTHLNSTKEVGEIKIIKASKIQDGVIRVVFTAGKASKKEEKCQQELIDELCHELCCDGKEKLIPARAEELFSLWKTVIKKKKKAEKKLISMQEFNGSCEELLAKVCGILRTQPEHLVKTVNRFKKELGM
ncbi:MAG: alanine--tRNA ligase [Candidatus Woesearchaeota archaeon]